MRVDVTAEFYVRVQAAAEAIAAAAQTLGQRTMQPEMLGSWWKASSSTRCAPWPPR